MALIKCQKCGNEISDKAEICPKCGTILVKDVKSDVNDKLSVTVPKKESRKRKKVNLVVAVAIGAICLIIGFGIGRMTASIQKSVHEIENEVPSLDENDSSEMITIDQNDDSSDIVQTQEIKEISLGDSVEINTEYGNYQVIVEHVRTCDWLERGNEEIDGMECLLIEADISNINFHDPYNEIFWLDNMLNVIDDESYTLDTLDFSYDDGSYARSPKIADGAKAKVFVPYKVNTSSNGVKININEQYELNATIER